MKFAVMLAAALTATPALAEDLDCSKAVTQMDMNQCALRDFEAADKRLNAIYRRVVAAQEGDGAKLKTAQRAWIAFRDAECAFETAESEGGSIHPMEFSMCLTKVTKARSKELEDYLACQKDAAKC